MSGGSIGPFLEERDFTGSFAKLTAIMSIKNTIRLSGEHPPTLSFAERALRNRHEDHRQHRQPDDDHQPYEQGGYRASAVRWVHFLNNVVLRVPPQ